MKPQTMEDRMLGRFEDLTPQEEADLAFYCDRMRVNLMSPGARLADAAKKTDPGERIAAVIEVLEIACPAERGSLEWIARELILEAVAELREQLEKNDGNE